MPSWRFPAWAPSWRGCWRLPTFAPIEQKALLVWGDADRSHRRSEPESALPHFRNAELVRFEGAGHCPDLEQPQRFANTLQAFSQTL